MILCNHQIVTGKNHKDFCQIFRKNSNFCLEIEEQVFWSKEKMKVLGSTFLTYRQNFVLYTHPFYILYPSLNKMFPKIFGKDCTRYKAREEGLNQSSLQPHNMSKQRYELIKGNVTRLSYGMCIAFCKWYQALLFGELVQTVPPIT